MLYYYIIGFSVFLFLTVSVMCSIIIATYMYIKKLKKKVKEIDILELPYGNDNYCLLMAMESLNHILM